MANSKSDYQMKMMLKYTRHGSLNTQSTRHNVLMQSIKHLQEQRGYAKGWDINRFGRKEVCRLTNDWREAGLKHSTIANRVVHLRWWANQIGKGDQIPCNSDLGISLRKNQEGYGESKSERLDESKLDPLPIHAQLSTRLRAEFGLRQEESLKFQYKYATKEPMMIRLKGSWTKGGRGREIPITNDRQRELLREIQAYARENGEKSLIPSHRTYKSYYRDYSEMRLQAQIPGHGLRHQWAQDRFEQASKGLKAPMAGGRPYAELNDSEKARWDRAAAIVNQELGHGAGRLDITATYIGAR